MIKYLFLILNFIGLLLINLFFGDVTVSINAPNEVAAGDSFTVEVTINKSDLNSFGRYYQELPIGYTATQINSSNGSFSFKDQKIKIIWMPKIPSDSIFSISYKVKVDPTIEGTLNLGGTFSYIFNNETKTLTIPSRSIIIRPQGFVASNNNQNNIDTTHQQSNNNVVSNNFPTNEIFCYRQIERDANGIIVHLLVNIANLPKDKFARIQETIPIGYTATNIESKDGIFNFKDNAVKFLWMSLPVENQFQVSYRLTASSGENPDISGNFSYVENDVSKKTPIENHDFINAQMTANNSSNQNNNQTNITSNQNNNQNNITSNQNNQNNVNNNQSNHTVDSLKLIANNNSNNQNNNVVNVITSPETGVRYKVQIAAGHNSVNPKYYFHQFNVSETVQMELHEGWHKYTIGSFTIYKDARDRRVQIWQNTPIRDAFVSAYNNGTRITVQEALMVANQKWYQ
jgi:hypothetical protein